MQIRIRISPGIYILHFTLPPGGWNVLTYCTLYSVQYRSHYCVIFMLWLAVCGTCTSIGIYFKKGQKGDKYYIPRGV